MDFVIVDGKVISQEELNVTPFIRNDTFKLTTSVWFGFGGIPLLKENTDNLKKQIEILKLTLPSVLNNRRELFRIIKRMLNKNRFYRSGLLYIHLFWNEDEVNYLITAHAFSTFEFPFQEKGILLDYSGQKKHSENVLNRFSFFNQPLWQADSLWLKDTGTDDLLRLNEKEAVCDCTGSNIFFIRDNSLLTPSLTSGCYEDTLRGIILKLAERAGLKVSEPEQIAISQLMHMEEIFIAGEATGIRWVLGIENKRFVHHYSVTVHKELNKFLREKVR